MLSLFAISCSGCDYTLIPSLGIQHHNFSTESGDIICLNFTAFPTFIIFNNFESDTFYHEYSAQTEEHPLKKQFSTEVRFLGVFRALLSPYSASAIETITGCDLAFSTAVLPGMCSEGIFFSTLPKDIVEFSDAQTGFFGLENLTDKCLIFSAQAQQTVTAEMQSRDYQDQLIFYTNWTNFTSISGNTTGVFTSVGNTEGMIVRLVTDEQLPPIAIKLSMQSEAEMPRFFDQAVFIPHVEAQQCGEMPKWYGEATARIVVVGTCLIGAFTLVMLLVECLCGPSGGGEVANMRSMLPNPPIKLP
jgi:hypothetical protein